MNLFNLKNQRITLSAPQDEEAADTVDVPLDDVAAHALPRHERALQVHRRSRFVRTEPRAVKRFAHHIRGKDSPGAVHDGQAHTVDGNRVARVGVPGDFWCAHGDADGVVKRL